jgi:ADP-ribose pyrophosphatase
VKKLSEKVLCRGGFLSLIESTFLSDEGKEIKWESVTRKNKKTVIVVTGVMKPSNRYVFIRQFRPPIDNFVLGFPAGLSEGKNIAEEALRELKEETGYTGKVIEISPSFKLSPALIDDDVHVVSVEIDEADPRNKKPVQELEPEEQIEVVLCEKHGINDLISSEIKAGRTVASGLWYMMFGS